MTNTDIRASVAFFQSRSKPIEHSSRVQITKWIIDSGATHHMTSNKEAFSELRQLYSPQMITIANGVELPATGIGRVHLRLTNKELLTLIDVLYTPDFKVDLLSVDALNDNGFDVKFNARNHSCQIRNFEIHSTEAWTFLGARVADRRSCFVYGHIERHQLEFDSSAPATAYGASIDNLSDTQGDNHRVPRDTHTPKHLNIPLSTWHRRFAHLNLATLKKVLPRHYYRDDMQNHIGSGPHIRKCDTCTLTKSKVRFQRKYRPRCAIKPLELVHADLCGPISPKSRSKKKYFLVLVDDFTRSVDIYFLNSKSNTIIVPIFKEYKTKKEAEFSAKGFKLKRL